jgi:hypothetical protein
MAKLMDQTNQIQLYLLEDLIMSLSGTHKLILTIGSVAHYWRHRVYRQRPLAPSYD